MPGRYGLPVEAELLLRLVVLKMLAAAANVLWYEFTFDDITDDYLKLAEKPMLRTKRAASDSSKELGE